jgi:hypothetical protein
VSEKRYKTGYLALQFGIDGLSRRNYHYILHNKPVERSSECHDHFIQHTAVQLNPYSNVTHLKNSPFIQHPVTAITQINPSITNSELEDLNGGALTVFHDDYSEDNFDNKRNIFVSDCLFDVKLF